MGSIIRVRCSHCFNDWELRVGYGMMHGRLERITPLFPEEDVKNLPLKKMQSMAIPWSFAYEPAHCGQCHALVSLPVLRYGKDAILTAPCPNCGTIPALIQQKRLPGTTCPACGKEALEVTETGLWD